MPNHDFIEWVTQRLEDNDEDMGDSNFEQAYAKGYHDALLLILDHLGVEHDKEYYW
jgi:hypothetical protein